MEQLYGHVLGGQSGTNKSISKQTSLVDFLNKSKNPSDKARLTELQNIDSKITAKDAQYKTALASGDQNAINTLGQELLTLASQKETMFPELAGMYSNTAESTPSLQEAMAEDTSYQKDAADKYLEEMGVLTSDKVSGLEGQMGRSGDAAKAYSDKLSKISTDASSPAFNLMLGNKAVPIVTNRQMSLADTLSGLAGKDYEGTRSDIDYQTSGIEKLFDTKGDQATRGLNVATEFTPNKSQIEYFDKLWPVIQSLQGNRFGTGTTTENATIGTSLAEKINSGLTTGTKINDMLKSWLGKEDDDSASGTSTAYTGRT